MCAFVAAGATGPSVAAPPLAPVVGTRGVPRFAWGTLRERLVRTLNRAAIGLPISTWLLMDVGLLSVAVLAAFAVFPPIRGLDPPHLALWQAASIFAFAAIISSLVFGLYERETLMSRSRILTRMLLTVTTATVIAYAVIYVVMYATVSRRASGLAMSLFLVSGTGIRLIAWWAIHKVHRKLLIVGSRSLFESFTRAQSEGFLHEYRLVGYATPCDDAADAHIDGGRLASEGQGAPATDDPFFIGPISDQLSSLGRSGVSDIVVGAGAEQNPRVMDWIVPGLQAGCRVTNEAIFYEKATGQILVDEITPSWFLFADLKVHCDEQATLKRIVDLTTASIGICLSVPFWPLIALAIKLCDGGPVFYAQDRVGQNGKLFKLFKFRTMRTDAENGKSVWASPNDPRVTPVGRFLRRARLDELPQLYNVLVGQMSIVGPRPERPDIVDQLCEKLSFYGERHLVKPGVTGWAQISFRYGSSIEDAKRKLQFDLYYLKHMSFELDIIILFRTAGTFLRGAC